MLAKFEAKREVCCLKLSMVAAAASGHGPHRQTPVRRPRGEMGEVGALARGGERRAGPTEVVRGRGMAGGGEEPGVGAT